MSEPWLVFLHGINDREDHLWLEPLQAGLSLFGQQPFVRDRIVRPDYREQLKGLSLEASLPSWPSTWTRLDAEAARRSVAEYLARASCLEARLRALTDTAVPPIPMPQAGAIPPLPRIVDDAKRYERDAKVRENVQHIVLRDLAEIPARSSIVIVAHSLGSVVAVDVLKKLPSDLRVEALITIGSPLGAIKEFRSNHDLKEFPYDRVRAWVNVFEPRDVVTAGRGVASHFPQAIDVPVTLPDWFLPGLTGEHGANFYCVHPCVASAIVGALNCLAVETTEPLPQLRIAGLELPLLQALYSRELSKRLPASQAERVVAFERARQVVAARHSNASKELAAATSGTSFLPPSVFLVNPDQHVRGLWDDPTLLGWAIMLASNLPAPPFEVEANPDTKERRRALQATLQLVRRRGSDLLDDEYVEAIVEARAKAVACLKAARGKTWVRTALVGAGALTLAATGVGFLAAVPAGLAGAAMLTSALAAFGPGGMVGGIATLAALASAGSAMAAVGTTLSLTGAQRDAPRFLATAFDEVIAGQNPEDLRAFLVSLLTLVHAQEALQFDSQRQFILNSCVEAESRLALLLHQHETIDRESPSAKATREMAGLLSRAAACLRGEAERAANPEATSAGENTQVMVGTAFAKALKGDTAELEAVLRRLELPAAKNEEIEP